jgi:hypothetical protein
MNATAAARRARVDAPARGGRPAAPSAPRRATSHRAASAEPERRGAPSQRAPGLARGAVPAQLVPLAVGRTAVAVSDLADSALVHRLTRGRLWIGVLTTLLVGIVALNVFALSFNASSSTVGRQADALERQISSLRARIATDGASNERLEAAAVSLGFVYPEPASITYLRPSRDDAAVAAKRLSSGELTAGPAVTMP